jgi:hypothetical protein
VDAPKGKEEAKEETWDAKRRREEKERKDARAAEDEEAWNKAFATSASRFYWIDDRRSYSLAELEAFWTKNPRSLYTPAGHLRSYSGDMDRLVPKSPETVVDYLRLEKNKTFLLDYTAAENQIDCPITRKPFKCPHIFPKTKWTYDQDALETLLKATLGSGHPLTLSKVTFALTDLQDMVSYPNRSLGCPVVGPETIRYCDRIPFVTSGKSAFDHLQPLRRDDAFVRDFCQPSPDFPGAWNIVGAARRYGYVYHGRDGYDRTDSSTQIAIVNLAISHAILFKDAVKSPSWRVDNDRVTFQNCHFRACVVVIPGGQYFPHLSGCRFQQCHFVIKFRPVQLSFPNCSIRDCTVDRGSEHSLSILFEDALRTRVIGE